MAAIHHILFPFDLSRQGVQAVPFVRAIARHCQARITVIGVVPPICGTPPMTVQAIAVDYEQAERDLQSLSEAALAKEFEGLPVQYVACSGDQALRITEFAHHNETDLIMMPTHGCGVFRSLLLGSVTAKVLHDAKCPVWTATHADEQHSQELPKTILCALDRTSRAAASLIRWAADFSHQLGARLELVNVVPRISDSDASSLERTFQEQIRVQARIQIDSLLRSAGLEPPVRIAAGQVADEVTEQARQESADLVIIGRGSLPSPLGRLRTHSYGIIQRSPCPVLSV